MQCASGDHFSHKSPSTTGRITINHRLKPESRAERKKNKLDLPKRGGGRNIPFRIGYLCDYLSDFLSLQFFSILFDCFRSNGDVESRERRRNYCIKLSKYQSQSVMLIAEPSIKADPHEDSAIGIARLRSANSRRRGRLGRNGRRCIRGEEYMYLAI